MGAPDPMKRERERIGPFVVTSRENLAACAILCAQCGKELTTCDPVTGDPETPPEALFRAGAVPVPNFGWFCGQACGDAYEAEFGVRFPRDATGRISDYGPSE
jgi:hypothetical protein